MFEQFQESFDKLVYKLGGWLDDIILAVPNIIIASLFLVMSILFARYLKKMMSKILEQTSANKTVIGLLGNLAVAIFMLIVLFIILNILNLNDAITALLGTAGVAGLAVGLAMQDPLTNLFSGVLMSVRDYYEVGDLVKSNGYFGKILKINLRSTIILAPDGQEVIIPNKKVLESPLTNYSHNKRRRIDISCGISYDDDLELAKEIAVKAIENSGLDIKETFPVELFYHEFGDSSINFTLRFWKNVTEQSDYLAAKDKAIIALKNAFNENGINIPYPIRTLDFGVSDGSPLNELYPPEKSRKR